MENYLIIAVLVAVLGGAAGYVYKSKKKGVKCIGCPNGCACNTESCGGNCGSCKENN